MDKIEFVYRVLHKRQTDDVRVYYCENETTAMSLSLLLFSLELNHVLLSRQLADVVESKPVFENDIFVFASSVIIQRQPLFTSTSLLKSQLKSRLYLLDSFRAQNSQDPQDWNLFKSAAQHVVDTHSWRQQYAMDTSEELFNAANITTSHESDEI